MMMIRRRRRPVSHKRRSLAARSQASQPASQVHQRVGGRQAGVRGEAEAASHHTNQQWASRPTTTQPACLPSAPPDVAVLSAQQQRRLCWQKKAARAAAAGLLHVAVDGPCTGQTGIAGERQPAAQGGGWEGGGRQSVSQSHQRKGGGCRLQLWVPPSRLYCLTAGCGHDSLGRATGSALPLLDARPNVDGGRRHPDDNNQTPTTVMPADHPHRE